MSDDLSFSDTRAEYRRIVGKLEFHSGKALLKVLGCLFAAVLIAFLPGYEGLPEAARWSLGIVVFAGLLWMTEAIPAFAIALLAIGLQILILGKPGGVMAGAEEVRAWEAYVRPWASPSMWLFFGGFVLARAANRTGLDRSLAGRLLALAGSRPERVLLVAMGTAFFFSMFMSNTATAAMMLAILGPMIAANPSPAGSRALIVGVAFACNLGGMGTIIGTPPNAIASGLLFETHPIDFLHWMLLGLPPALVLVTGLWWALSRRVRSSDFGVAIPAADGDEPEESLDEEGASPPGRGLDRWRRWTVPVVFLVTVGLWLTGGWHGMPTAVVSFVPIVIFSITGVITAHDMRTLDWDILILLAGGLSLGVGVSESGLADWMAGRLGEMAAPPWALASAFALLTLVLSNFMSNTAASNILIPMGIAAGVKAGGGAEAAAFAVPMALTASAAMCLPISTPPNAIAYAGGRLRASDFLVPGVIVGILAWPLTILWCRLVLGWTG